MSERLIQQFIFEADICDSVIFDWIILPHLLVISKTQKCVVGTLLSLSAVAVTLRPSKASVNSLSNSEPSSSGIRNVQSVISGVTSVLVYI